MIMKAYTMLLVISVGACGAAVPPLLPEKLPELPGAPQMSPSEAIQLRKFPAFDPVAPQDSQAVPLPVLAKPRYVSRMPILEPRSANDRNMPIASPQPDIDFKMIVKKPDVISVK